MFLVVSFSHKNTDISIRHRLSLVQRDNAELLEIVRAVNGVEEVMVVSTCNRCEVYVYTLGVGMLVCKEIVEKLSRFKGLDPVRMSRIANLYVDADAIRHVFSVASSLDSLVVGETQITGQLKNAYEASLDNGFCGKEFEKLMKFAFKCAADVRNKTKISREPVSVPSIAVNSAVEYFSKSNKEVRTLIIGAGEIGGICLKNLIRHTRFTVTLANRTLQSAMKLLESVDVHHKDRVNVIGIGEMRSVFNDFDLVFSAVGGGLIVEANLFSSRHVKRLIFDLSVPRNIEFPEGVASNISENVELVTIDDLKTRAFHHINSRRHQAEAGAEIVSKYVADFQIHRSKAVAEPIIKVMRENAKRASVKELNKAIKKGFISRESEKNVEKLLHNAFNEFLHSPTIRLKSMASRGEEQIIEQISSIFGGDVALKNA